MINNLIAGLLGLVFMTLAKMQSTKKDFATANQPFVSKKFFEDELIAILMSITFIAIMAFTVKEWMNISTKATEYVTIIFALGGAIGSWAFLLFLGKSKKYIRKIIDIKTNIVDNELGKTGGIRELTAKAEEHGKDITQPGK